MAFFSLFLQADGSGGGGSGGRKNRRGLTTMSLNESRGSAGGGAGSTGAGTGAGGVGGSSSVAGPTATQISADGNSTVTVSGRKSNWEVIEHYRNSGEPPALMATMSHTGTVKEFFLYHSAMFYFYDGIRGL